MPSSRRGRTFGPSDEPAAKQTDLTNSSTMDHRILVGGATDGHRVHHLHGSLHQVLRCAHAIFESEETARAPH